LNDAEDDDVDVYDGNPNQGRTRLAYDALDREDHNNILTGNSVRARNKPEMVSLSYPQPYKK
jgi:hypothetical protein